MAHDFKLFPELTNSQMQIYYFDSPHKQMVEPFDAKVIRVKDGDTIQVTTEDRDFDFPIRFARIAAPELDEVGGLASQKWLAKEIQGKDIEIVLTRQRVGKWGRLLGEINHLGMSLNQQSLDMGYSIKFEEIENAAVS